MVQRSERTALQDGAASSGDDGHQRKVGSNAAQPDPSVEDASKDREYHRRLNRAGQEAAIGMWGQAGGTHGLLRPNHHVRPGGGQSFQEEAMHSLCLEDSSIEPTKGHLSACRMPFVPEPGFVDIDIHKQEYLLKYRPSIIPAATVASVKNDATPNK